MTKTAYMISLNYKNAQGEAEKLSDLSRQIGNWAKKIEGFEKKIDAAWDGDNSDLYIRKLGIISENLLQIENDIMSVSGTIKRIAKRTYDSEMESLEISQKRSYSGSW